MTKIRYIIPRIYGAIGYKQFYSLSYQVLDLFFSESYRKAGFNPFNYYEFGTGEGRSIRYYLKALKKLSPIWKKIGYNISDFRIFLFDSFEGLPEYDGERDKNPIWKKGQFKGSIDEIKKVIKKTYAEILPNVRFIKGYFENTLNDELKKELSPYPPSFVNIDVDYYSSAKYVLNFISSIFQEGTICYFDDIFEYLGNPTKGELAAIDEYNRDHQDSQLGHFRRFNISALQDSIYVIYKPVIDSSKLKI
ncbi:MAG: TylF/MycF/NovP-related O-methyltransferase [Thermoplasmata archaeon]